MKRAAALVYIVTGLLFFSVYLPIVRLILALMPPFGDIAFLAVFCVGPSLLVLAGTATAWPNLPQNRIVFLAASAILATVALSQYGISAPRFYWYIGILLPVGVSLFIASVLMMRLKERWLPAIVGSVASAPLFLLNAAGLLAARVHPSGILRGEGFSALEVGMLASALFGTLSLLFAIRLKRD